MKQLSVTFLSSVGLLLTGSSVIASEEVPDSLQRYINNQISTIIARKAVDQTMRNALVLVQEQTTLANANKEYDKTLYVPNIPKRATPIPEQGDGDPWRKVTEAEKGKSARFIVNFYHSSATIQSPSRDEIEAQRTQLINAIKEDKKIKALKKDLEESKIRLQGRSSVDAQLQKELDDYFQAEKNKVRSEKEPYEAFKEAIIAEHAKRFKNYTEHQVEGEGLVEQGWLGSYLKT